jgi:hypothetical protein
MVVSNKSSSGKHPSPRIKRNPVYRHRITATVAAASVVTLSAAGCISHTVAGNPTTASPTAMSVTLPQAELLRDFAAEQDPMSVFKDGFYYLLRQPMATSVAITGYRHQVATDGATSKVAAFAFMPPTGAWQQIPDRELVWSPSQAKWVETDRTEALSPGPAGSRGWPTVKGVSDAGTSYYTFSYQDLGGRALSDGLEAGFDEGVGLPQSAQAGKFTPGARAYLMTETSVDPFFTIHRVKHADTGIDDLQLVFTCVQPTPDCKAPTPDLVVLATLGGEFTNLSGTTRLELDGHGHATLRPVGVPDIPFATLTYRTVQNDKPERITLQAANPEDADKFAKAMGNNVENFAFVDYEGQVTVGFAEPANTTTTVFAGYNRIAANDLLTQWTPALPAVLP